MKIKSYSCLRLFKALIATVLLVLGCHQAAAQLDPVAQHQDRPVDGPQSSHRRTPRCMVRQDLIVPLFQRALHAFLCANLLSGCVRRPRGPVASVHLSQLPIFGHSQCQANAFLSPGLITGKPHQTVFGNADGTGSSTDPAVAKHIAISEALERWAFFETQRESETKFGFDHDRSSNGMAAYTSLPATAPAEAWAEVTDPFERRWLYYTGPEGYLCEIVPSRFEVPQASRA